MPGTTDSQLVEKLLNATRRGKIKWEKTAAADRFAASYGGKWTLVVDRASDEDAERMNFYLAITNVQGDEILRVWDQRDNQLPELFEQARRHALRVNEALHDLMREIGETDIDGEDIPF